MFSRIAGWIHDLRVKRRQRRADRNMQVNLRWFVSELLRSTPDVRWDRLEQFNVGSRDEQQEQRDQAIAEATALLNADGGAWDTPDGLERMRALLGQWADLGEQRAAVSAEERRAYALGCAEERWQQLRKQMRDQAADPDNVRRLMEEGSGQ